jgi:hypothetical protein
MDQCVKSSRSGKKKRDAAGPPDPPRPAGRQRRPRNADLPHLDERPPLPVQPGALRSTTFAQSPRAHSARPLPPPPPSEPTPAPSLKGRSKRCAVRRVASGSSAGGRGRRKRGRRPRWLGSDGAELGRRLPMTGAGGGRPTAPSMEKCTTPREPRRLFRRRRCSTVPSRREAAAPRAGARAAPRALRAAPRGGRRGGWARRRAHP